MAIDAFGLVQATKALDEKISEAYEEERRTKSMVACAHELSTQLRDFLREQGVEESLRARLNDFMGERCAALLKTADAHSEYARHVYGLRYHGEPFTMAPPGTVDATQECKDYQAALRRSLSQKRADADD